MNVILVESVAEVTVEISRQLHEHGWALIATPYEGLLHHYTLGLPRRWHHPDLEAFGLDEERGAGFITTLVARIAAGKRYRSGDFLSDLVPGFDLFLVENPIDPAGEPITGGRLRLVWPDAEHRYPWHADCEARCACQRFIPPPADVSLEALQAQLGVLGRIN